MDGYIKRHPKKGKPVIWQNPITGEYQIPMHDYDPMPERLKIRGFVRREFDSYFEHQAWCRKMGLVNHAVEDVRGDGDLIPDWDYLKGVK